MYTVNRTILIGHLGSNPTMKVTTSGKTVTILHMATNQNYRVKTEAEQEEFATKTVWHRVAVWGRPAELAGNRLKKGDKVFIEGYLDKRSYEDASGKTHYIVEVKANLIEYIQSLSYLKPIENTPFSTIAPTSLSGN